MQALKNRNVYVPKFKKTLIPKSRMIAPLNDIEKEYVINKLAHANLTVRNKAKKCVNAYNKMLMGIKIKERTNKKYYQVVY